MFYALGIFIISFVLLMFIYIISRFRKLYIISKISNKKISWIVSIIPALFLAGVILFDSINGIVILIYLSLFSLLFDLIFKIIKKITKKEFKYYFSFLLAIIVTIAYLSNSYFLAHHVVRTNYTIETTKEIGTEKLRIVQISDVHIGATMDGDKFISYMKEINKTNPDVVVVTGDFVDDDTSKDDMIKGCKGLSLLKSNYGVYYINGNHDAGYFDKSGYTYDDLKHELENNNIKVLEDEHVMINNSLYIIGRIDNRYSKERKSIYELVNNLDETKYIIDLNHQPTDYENESKTKIDLVLSGHTHGGQLFPLGPLSVITGLNDSYYGLKKINNTNFIVSSGLGNWALKFKSSTISEYVIIDIVKK